MDLLVVQRLAAELDEHLRGARIGQVWALPKKDVVLALDRRSDPRLWFAAEPDDPHLYLRAGSHPTPARPPGFAMAARNLLVGRRIEAVRTVPGDRIIELLCSGDGIRVIFELIPRRATALVVDGDGTVRATWQPRRGRPALGDHYTPPEADGRPPLDGVSAETWTDLRDLPDADALVRGLLRSIAGMSPLVAREIAFRWRDGTAVREAAEQELRRAATEPSAPRIYAPEALDRLRALPPARRFLIAPYPLHHLDTEDDLPSTPFPTLREAAAAFYPLRARVAALQQARKDLETALELGVGRVRRTLDAVAEDADDAGDADQLRRWADLLLSYPRAPRDGDLAHVPDPQVAEAETEEPAELEIPIDPAKSLVANAQDYYRRARRAERSIERTATRRHRLQARIGKLAALSARIEAADDLDACVDIARDARRLGVSVPTTGWLPPEAARADDEPAVDATPTAPPRARRPPTGGRKIAGVDRFRSSDGCEILVGRSAKGNEHLTHKLAQPDDFWLHAEGPGSHVLIRNPQRADVPSADALREAASLAAWFSRSRGATKVNVRWTQARHVKKPRGAPTGQVVMRESSSYLAEPVEPSRLLGDDGDDVD